MTDLVLLAVLAGNGGDGKVSFLRQKFRPKGGPDGGMGGDGGDVVIRATTEVTTLSHLAGTKAVAATGGEAGGSNNKRGKNGEPTEVLVPVGTYVWQVSQNEVAARRLGRVGITRRLARDQAEFEQCRYEYAGAPRPAKPVPEPLEYPITTDDLREHGFQPANNDLELLADLAEPEQTIVLSQGGFGGRGNESFKSATEQAPMRAEWGTPGEQRLVILELRLLADVGLVGYPNAGKSTLLSVLTKARPKIANYPFTTLEPHLGVATAPSGSELVIADIPGLIEGASQGKGLGYDFLRHVDHCSKLLFVLSLEDYQLEEATARPEYGAQLLWEQYQRVVVELRAYNPAILEKQQLIGINKIDLYSEEVRTAMLAVFAQAGLSPLFFSAGTTQGVAALLTQLAA